MSWMEMSVMRNGRQPTNRTRRDGEMPIEIHNRMFFPIVKIIDNRSNNQFYCNHYESTNPCLAQYALHCLILTTRRVPFLVTCIFFPDIFFLGAIIAAIGYLVFYNNVQRRGEKGSFAIRRLAIFCLFVT